MSYSERSLGLMSTEKILCYASLVIASLVAIVFLLDAAIGLLGKASLVFDILMIVGAALVLWQALETSRELR